MSFIGFYTEDAPGCLTSAGRVPGSRLVSPCPDETGDPYVEYCKEKGKVSSPWVTLEYLIPYKTDQSMAVETCDLWPSQESLSKKVESPHFYKLYLRTNNIIHSISACVPVFSISFRLIKSYERTWNESKNLESVRGGVGLTPDFCSIPMPSRNSQLAKGK